MEFRNHTPFPAMAFEGIDQHDQAFHVIVLRQTLSFASGKLEYADEQAQLCEVDEFFGEMNQSSVRQESDLCQYKPKCDVIVNATAYAPGGKQSKRFEVELLIQRPSTLNPLPEMPRGLNPLQGPNHQQMEEWRNEVRQAQRTPLPGEILLNKKLIVTGERHFKKWIWPLPLLTTLIKWSSLGLIHLNPWRLTATKAVTSVPLRSEYAYGGQCRIDVNERAARRVKKRHRLTPEQVAQHPSAGQTPGQQAIAHTAFERNPIGRGYAQQWHIAATGMTTVPAPQIAYPGKPITARLFHQISRGKIPDRSTSRMVAGLGVRAKGHPERRPLLGTIDAEFINSPAWLPQDFDFAVWSAAQPDQQIDYLKGDEIITMTNLCQHDHPAATIDAQGNTILKFKMPKHECFLLLRMKSGQISQHPLSIDTLMIEPEKNTLTLVWRTVLAKDPDASIRVCEARMQTHKDRDELQRDMRRIEQFLKITKKTSTANYTAPMQSPSSHLEAML